MGRAETSIKILKEARDQVRQLKRGQESYNELPARLAEEFDPEPPETEV